MDQNGIGLPAVTLSQAARVWAKVAMLSFGGPAGQIAVMHRILVEEKKWISEARFLHALNYCMLLPGPEAQQLATYLGWLMHRTAGGLIAGGLFILPGFVAILALSVVYVTWGQLPAVEGVFHGLKAAVIAVVIEAVVRIGRRALKGPTKIALAAGAFVGIFFLGVPFPFIVLGAGVIGWLTAGEGSKEVQANDSRRPTWRRTIGVTGLGLALWWGPIAGLAGAVGWEHVYVREALFFSKAAVMTFGGAYAVLPYVAQQAVERFGWLSPGQMLDGLGLAETTPGPLIMVVQFVGFLGAYHHAGDRPSLAAGVMGACVTVWVTFVPCFLWVFLGAPYVERLRGHAPLSGALSCITAAVVGVILNLAVWFGLHTLFAGGTFESVDIPGLLIAVAALAAMLRFKVAMIPVLAAAAMIGLLLSLARG